MKPHTISYQQVDSEERYQCLFETAPDGILILDANTFITKLSGYTKEELLDKHIWDLGFIKNIDANKDKNIDFPWPIAEIVYQHHERLDGSGYPRGLKGKDIFFICGSGLTAE